MHGLPLAVFVFDEQQLEAEGWRWKRVGFVYECLLELRGVNNWRGPLVETLAQFESIMTISTLDPWLQPQSAVLGAANIRAAFSLGLPTWSTSAVSSTREAVEEAHSTTWASRGQPFPTDSRYQVNSPGVSRYGAGSR